MIEWCTKNYYSNSFYLIVDFFFHLGHVQVRDFFASQRTRVRKFIRLSREKAIRSEAAKDAYADVLPNSDSSALINPVPLSAIGPSSTEEAPSSLLQNDALSNISELDKHFVNNIFNLMGREETFSGQVKLMKWILQIQNIAVLSWYFTPSILSAVILLIYINFLT